MLMIGKRLTVEQRLQKAVVDITAHPRYRAMASILCIGKRTVDETFPTAYTDGKNEGYGREFCESLNDAQLRGLILHENYHKMYRHLITWRHLFKEDAELAGKATDYMINIKIVDENPDGFAKMPPNPLLDERFRGMDVARIYKILKSEGQGGQGKGGGKPGDGSPDGTGFDDHDWEASQNMDEAEQNKLEREIDAAIRQGCMAAGKIPGSDTRGFDDLLRPKVDWREPTREWLTQAFAGRDFTTWRRPDRRSIGTKLYRPSHYGESTGGLVIACDTSGSIGQAELTRTLTEVAHMCETISPEWVRILYWDTAVAGDEFYNHDELDKIVSSTKPKGGGGTMVECVPQYLVEYDIKPKGVIVFTDGYLGGSWGEWHVPVLWAVMGNPSATASVGQTIHIDI